MTRPTGFPDMWADTMIQPDDRASDTIVEARKTLQDDIEKLVAPYRAGPHKEPPFSTGELLAMATICSTSWYSTPKEMLKWIFDTFPYFQRRFVEDHFDFMEDDADGPPGDILSRTVPSFFESFHEYEVPLIDSPEYRNYCTTEVDSARIFLRRWLQPERKGAFRFLDLPPELRNRIYEMLVIFPDPAIHVYSTRSQCLSFCAHGRTNDTLNAEPCQPGRCVQFCHAGRCVIGQDVLSLALACQQISNEVLPLFYGGNTFAFACNESLYLFARQITPQLIRRIKRIHISLNRSDAVPYSLHDDLQWAMGPLAAVSSLQELTILADDGGWLRPYRVPAGKQVKWEKFADIPSLRQLAGFASRAEKLQVFSNPYNRESSCEEFSDFMHKEVRRLKEEAAQGAEQAVGGSSDEAVVKETPLESG